jgi:O-methyltransferase
VLHQVAPERVAFMHLDLNSPRAEIGALEILFDRVVHGGIIVFDDYGWKLFHKQKEAADRFMTERGQVILELPTGQGLMIRR